jgi:hypothetical protein
MDLFEAYEFTLEKVRELMDDGIHVNMIVPKLASNLEVVRKAKEKGGAIPSDKWVRISFKNLDKMEAEKVLEKGNYLGLCGISFDCGGSEGVRDWELDWSFTYNKGQEMLDWIESREQIEDNINNDYKLN